MKHPFKITAIIISWLIVGVGFGMLLAPRAILTFSPIASQINPYTYIGIIMLLILSGAFAWTKMMKHWQPKYVETAFAIGMGLIASRGISLLFPNWFYQSTLMYALLVRGAWVFLITILFLKMVRLMQSDWNWTRRLTPISNAFMIFATAVAGVIIAVHMAPWIAIVLLGLASIYDAIAVWKTKHMVSMAKYFVERRVIPGLAVPYKDKPGEFALLGGGDVFFIVLVATSFFKSDPLAMYILSTTMVGSVIALFLTSRKNTYYPALPFILGGALLGVYLLMFI